MKKNKKKRILSIGNSIQCPEVKYGCYMDFIKL